MNKKLFLILKKVNVVLQKAECTSFNFNAGMSQIDLKKMCDL